MGRTVVGLGALVVAMTIAAMADDDAVTRTLHVVDQDGRSVSGVVVRPTGGDEWDEVRTDAAGLARFAAAKVAKGSVTFFDGRDERTVALRDALTEVVAAHYPVAEIVVVDGTDGHTMDTVPVRIVGQGGDLAAGLPRVRVATDVIGRCAFDFAIDPPPGLVAARNAWSGQVAVRATRVRLTVAVYPEIRRKLRIVDGANRPLRGARLTMTTIEGPGSDSTAALRREYPDADTADAEGRLEVAGLPRIPLGRATLGFHAKVADDVPDRAQRGRELEGLVEIALDQSDPIGPIRVELGSPPPDWRPPGAPQSLPRDPPRGPAFVVRVLRGDGVPVPRVNVRIGDAFAATDADGRARFVGLAKGSAVATVYGLGVVPTAASVEVPGTGEATVHEGSTQRVHVEVVDGGGHPLCCAGVGPVSMTVPGPDGKDVVLEDRIAQFDGDVELIDSLTDANGRADVDLPVGRHRIGAWIGGVFAFVETPDENVRVVLRRKP